jgi:hypothetical protein
VKSNFGEDLSERYFFSGISDFFNTGRNYNSSPQHKSSFEASSLFLDKKLFF